MKGREQLKGIIDELLERHIHFDLINNVLTSKALKGVSLWYWFGDIRIVPEELRYESPKAGDLDILGSWEYDEEYELIRVYPEEKE